MSIRYVRLWSTRVTAILSCLLFGLATASPALAQKEPSHWGAQVSFVKSWTMADQVKKLLSGDEGSEVKIEGSEFEIGFVRGSTLGGDWGVSFRSTA